MAPVPRSQVNAAIERALADSADRYEERGILVIKHLEATVRLSTHEPILDEALYTLFRALPERVAAGATLFISTLDRAGGDVELVWEARELPTGPEGGARSPLGGGPYADLLELALEGLEAHCRVRASHAGELVDDEMRSSAVLQYAPHIRRRYTFLIPSLSRRAWAGAA